MRDRGVGMWRPADQSRVDYVCSDCRGLNLAREVVEVSVAGAPLDVVFCAWCKRRHYYWTQVRPLEPDLVAAMLGGDS